MGSLFALKSFLETVSQSITLAFMSWFGHPHSVFTQDDCGKDSVFTYSTFTSAVLSKKKDFLKSPPKN